MPHTGRVESQQQEPAPSYAEAQASAEEAAAGSSAEDTQEAQSLPDFDAA
jgi:hypothetical protein